MFRISGEELLDGDGSLGQVFGNHVFFHALIQGYGWGVVFSIKGNATVSET